MSVSKIHDLVTQDHPLGGILTKEPGTSLQRTKRFLWPIVCVSTEAKLPICRGTLVDAGCRFRVANSIFEAENWDEKG